MVHPERGVAERLRLAGRSADHLGLDAGEQCEPLCHRPPLSILLCQHGDGVDFHHPVLHFLASSSSKTFFATLSASTATGQPAYHAACVNASQISSRGIPSCSALRM